jgi:hypothetical protein
MGLRLLPLLCLLCVVLTGCTPKASVESASYNCCPCCECCTPPVTPPQPPEDDLPPEVDSVFELSRQAAEKLNDAATARQLGTAILTACDAAAVAADTVEAIRIIQDATRKVLIERDGKADLVDWRNGWRAPVSDLIAQRNPNTPAQYAELMRHAARGLLAAAVGASDDDI